MHQIPRIFSVFTARFAIEPCEAPLASSKVIITNKDIDVRFIFGLQSHHVARSPQQYKATTLAFTVNTKRILKTQSPFQTLSSFCCHLCFRQKKHFRTVSLREDAELMNCLGLPAAPAVQA
jgi:hypothetical protein